MTLGRRGRNTEKNFRNIKTKYIKKNLKEKKKPMLQNYKEQTVWPQRCEESTSFCSFADVVSLYLRNIIRNVRYFEHIDWFC